MDTHTRTTIETIPSQNWIRPLLRFPDILCDVYHILFSVFSRNTRKKNIFSPFLVLAFFSDFSRSEGPPGNRSSCKAKNRPPIWVRLKLGVTQVLVSVSIYQAAIVVPFFWTHSHLVLVFEGNPFCHGMSDYPLANYPNKA